jgi:hypothetical protein
MSYTNSKRKALIPSQEFMIEKNAPGVDPRAEFIDALLGRL